MIQKATFLKVAAALAAGLLLLGCKPEPKVIELSVSDKTVAFETAGGNKTVTVTCNDAWTATCAADWVEPSPKSGNGSGSIKITAKPNPSFDVRSADIIVTAGDKSQTIKVNQLAPTPSLILDKETLEAEAAGGEFTVTVTSNAPWTITIPAEAAWVTADKASGNGNGSVKFTVAATDVFEAREAQISFAFEGQTKTLKVQQAALVPSLTISKESFQAPSEGGTAEVDVEANVAWTVVIPEGCNWITADKASGTGNDKVTFTVAENIYRATRTATVVFQGDQSQQKEIIFSQEMAPLSRRTDSLTLVAVYNASDGATWAKNKWDLSKPMTEWPAVTLTNGRVTALKLSTSGVITKEWTLPAEIADLTELTDLRINSNKLTGEIPDAVYDLAKLEYLYFQNNNITGALSPKLGQLTKLIQLYVDRNANMTGSIPKEIGNLKKLERINISQSGISGGIPAELGQCESLVQFMAFNTKLSGELPDIWDMPVLQTVMIHTNPGLTGNLPASLGKLKPLAAGNAPSLQLHGCSFTGNIPESFANLPENTKQVFLEKNKMSGVIPAAVQAHPNFSNWRYDPQQEGYGLTLRDGSGGQDLDPDTNADPWK